MKTKIVDKTTYFFNKFSKQGRRANEIVDVATGAVYQRKILKGKLALQTKDGEGDRLYLINKDVSYIEKLNKTQDVHLGEGVSGRLYQSCRKYCDRFAPAKEILKERFYANSHLYETAEREIICGGGPVKKTVFSYCYRQSEFPSTQIGKSLTKVNMSLVSDDFRVRVYAEEYPYD